MVFDYFRATKSQTNLGVSEQRDQMQVSDNLIKTTSKPEFDPSMATTSVPQDVYGEALDRLVTEDDFNGNGDIDQAHLLPMIAPDQVPNSLLSDGTGAEVTGDALQKDVNPVQSMTASTFAPPVPISTTALETLHSPKMPETNVKDGADTTKTAFLTPPGNELSKETTLYSDASRAPVQEQMTADTQLPEMGDSGIEGAATATSQADVHMFSFPDTTASLATVDTDSTSAEKPSMKSDLSQYSPGPLPRPFKRASSTPPPCGTHYSFMANWPPQKPPTCDLKNRVDVFPPKDAPLHVWIQAYSLRWGVWCAEIKDDALRDQVLGAVTDKMKMAWETAINQGYYKRPPPADELTDQQNESDGQKKKSRKRAVSPSRQPAGFACDGSDKTAVTNGELQNVGLTMEMINDRAQRKDFQEGEAKLDDVMYALNGSRIMIGNWSVAGNRHGVVVGRNLLMYCFYTVQESRTEQERLKKLLQKMKGPHQIKITENRISLSEEREHQHMALATELTLMEKAKSISDSVDKDDDEVEDITPVDLVSEAENTDDGHATSDNSQLSTKSEPEAATPNPRELIVDLVRDLLGKRSELEIHAIFTSRKLTPMSFSDHGLDVGDDQELKLAKHMLGNVFLDINSVNNHRSRMSREQPNEAIRIGHDVRLLHERIEQVKQNLFELLKKDLYPPHTDEESSPSEQAKVGTSHQPGNHITELGGSSNMASSPMSHVQKQGIARSYSPTRFAPGSSDPGPVLSQAQSPMQVQGAAIPVAQPVPNNPLQASPSGINQAPIMANSSQDNRLPSSPAKPPTEADIQDFRLKQAFVAQHWSPFMKTYMANHNISRPQSPITSWVQMRDIFTAAGMTTDERNMMNRKFKAGFEAYKHQHGLSSAPNLNTASPIPSTSNKLSLATPNTSLQQININQWPSNEEIISTIPAQGISASDLLRRFDARIGGAREQFMERIPRIARYNPHTYMVFPPIGKTYNTAPPQFAQQSQSRSTVSPANQMSPSPAQPNRNVVRLKVAPQNQQASNISPLTPVNESTFPTEFKSTEISSSQGFSFRWLPHSTLAQRQRNDDAMAEYISKMSKSRRKKHGQYVTINDVDDPSGPPVAHGVWQIGKKPIPEDLDWFFNGENKPVNWDARQKAGDGIDSDETNHMQSQPRLKLKVNAPVPPADGPNQSFTKYNTYPPAYPGTVNPTQLLYDYTQSYPAQTQGGNTATKRGTKRVAAGTAGRGTGARTKKRRTNANMIIEDGGYEDAGDSDYDPSQDS